MFSILLFPPLFLLYTLPSLSSISLSLYSFTQALLESLSIHLHNIELSKHNWDTLSFLWHLTKSYQYQTQAQRKRLYYLKNTMRKTVLKEKLAWKLCSHYTQVSHAIIKWISSLSVKLKLVSHRTLWTVTCEHLPCKTILLITKIPPIILSSLTLIST